MGIAGDGLSCSFGERGMSVSTLSQPAASALDREHRDVRHALAVLVALIEMAAVAASTYLAFIAYHLIFWKGEFPFSISYGWLCAGLSVIYGVICLADKQYDFLGAEWKRRGLERGLLALTKAFVLLLGFLFLTGTEASYSRGHLSSRWRSPFPFSCLSGQCFGRPSKQPGNEATGSRPA